VEYAEGLYFEQFEGLKRVGRIFHRGASDGAIIEKERCLPVFSLESRGGREDEAIRRRSVGDVSENDRPRAIRGSKSAKTQKRTSALAEGRLADCAKRSERSSEGDSLKYWKKLR